MIIQMCIIHAIAVAGSLFVNVEDFSGVKMLGFGAHNDKVTTPQIVDGINILSGNGGYVCNNVQQDQLLDLRGISEYSVSGEYVANMLIKDSGQHASFTCRRCRERIKNSKEGPSGRPHLP
jgi:hypothetical protein